MGENDGDRTHDTQGHNLVLYQLSYILRRSLCLHDSKRVCNLQEHLLGRPLGMRQASQPWARRAAMILTNDLLRISSSDSPVASASCSVTAPHAMPRRK